MNRQPRKTYIYTGIGMRIPAHPGGFAPIAALLLLSFLLGAAPVFATVQQDRFEAGGYFRIMSRPDLQGGNGKLGWWNAYGRLMNEGPWFMLNMKHNTLPEETPGKIWARVTSQVEGGSILNTDEGQGNLGNFYLSRMFIEVGNVGLPNLDFQVGTLNAEFGDLGLYDMKPADLFTDTVGIKPRFRFWKNNVLIEAAAGDSGFAVLRSRRNDGDRGARETGYAPVFTGGLRVSVHPLKWLDVGMGGQVNHENAVTGNAAAPHQTENFADSNRQFYEWYLRRELVKNYLDKYPAEADDFVSATSRSARSYKTVAYAGFGGFKALPKFIHLNWDSTFLSFEKKHPKQFYNETWGDKTERVYINELTDQRYALTLGNEAHIAIWKNVLDLNIAALYIMENDGDNTIAPSDENRRVLSTVWRFQYFVLDYLHILLEQSFARELSINGNKYREHFDSIGAGRDGKPENRGLEWGDADTKYTYQLKFGPVLNPRGKGIYNRPSVRLLFGWQYSNVNAAFGNTFDAALAKDNRFAQEKDIHNHYMLAIEAENWF